MGRNALRAATEGMARPLDPAAERVRLKKAKKDRAKLRHAFKHEGPTAAAKFFLTGGVLLPPPSDECAECKAMQDERNAA
jgi:hypothetical protein